ncbi:MAG: hypothetical protein KME10_18015 [Plectolyngbya sp. WJT66-NPBG17]|jgi:AcrR family transcriptional regulator|nr:hypothetical protein [Plectolyngbya sp. WJT66-NPBG17]
MKLSSTQIQSAFEKLFSEDTSVRSLAKELNVQPSALTYRFKKEFGEDYLSLSKGLNFSLLKSLKNDVLPALTPSEQIVVRNWMQQNLHRIAAPSNIYTEDQLDRLTYTEIGSERDWRDSFTSDEYEIIGYESLSIPNEVSLAAPSDFPDFNSEKSSYINSTDLTEVLVAFFEHELDHCDPYLHNLYRPLHELHPSNSLWSLVDDDLITEAFHSIQPELAALLVYQFDPQQENLEQLAHFFYQTEYSTLNDFISALTPIAFEELAEQIRMRI